MVGVHESSIADSNALWLLSVIHQIEAEIG